MYCGRDIPLFTTKLFTKGWNFYIILTLKIIMMLILHDLLRMLAGDDRRKRRGTCFGTWLYLKMLEFVSLGAFIPIDVRASLATPGFFKSNVLITVMTSYVHRMIGNWFDSESSVRAARDWNWKWEVISWCESFVTIAELMCWYF